MPPRAKQRQRKSVDEHAETMREIERGGDAEKERAELMKETRAYLMSKGAVSKRSLVTLTLRTASCLAG